MGPPDEDLTAAPGGAAWPQHGDRERALDLWRGGERLRRRKLTPGCVTDYEYAVAIGLAHLQRYATLDELAQVYFSDSHATDPEDWLATACHAQSGRVLNVGLVEDAAYWRHAQQAHRRGGGVSTPARRQPSTT